VDATLFSTLIVLPILGNAKSAMRQFLSVILAQQLRTLQVILNAQNAELLDSSMKMEDVLKNPAEHWIQSQQQLQFTLHSAMNAIQEEEAAWCGNL